MNIEITVEGITPLLQNRFTEQNEVKVSSGISPVLNPSNGLSPREQADAKRYTDEKGNSYIPADHFFQSVINAGRFVKVGKSKLTTNKSSLVPAFVQITPLVIPLKTTNGWEVDSRSVVIPSTGGRIMCHRPRFDGWKAAFSIVLDEKGIGEKLLRQLFDDAGSKVGIGDYRPQRKGPFGRFKVVTWKIV